MSRVRGITRGGPGAGGLVPRACRVTRPPAAPGNARQCTQCRFFPRVQRSRPEANSRKGLRWRHRRGRAIPNRAACSRTTIALAARRTCGGVLARGAKWCGGAAARAKHCIPLAPSRSWRTPPLKKNALIEPRPQHPPTRSPNHSHTRPNPSPETPTRRPRPHPAMPYRRVAGAAGTRSCTAETSYAFGILCTKRGAE